MRRGWEGGVAAAALGANVRVVAGCCACVRVVVAMIALLALAQTEVCTDAPEDPYVYRLSKVARQSGATPFHWFHSEAGLERIQADDVDGAAAHFRAAGASWK